eukprot:6646001-Lingulodinium_polyedra.AAC.1
MHFAGAPHLTAPVFHAPPAQRKDRRDFPQNKPGRGHRMPLWPWAIPEGMSATTGNNERDLLR